MNERMRQMNAGLIYGQCFQSYRMCCIQISSQMTEIILGESVNG